MCWCRRFSSRKKRCGAPTSASASFRMRRRRTMIGARASFLDSGSQILAQSGGGGSVPNAGVRQSDADNFRRPDDARYAQPPAAPPPAAARRRRWRFPQLRLVHGRWRCRWNAFGRWHSRPFRRRSRGRGRSFRSGARDGNSVSEHRQQNQQSSIGLPKTEPRMLSRMPMMIRTRLRMPTTMIKTSVATTEIRSTFERAVGGYARASLCSWL